MAGSDEHCCVPLCTGSSQLPLLPERYQTSCAVAAQNMQDGTQHTKVRSRHFEKGQIHINVKGRRLLAASAVPSLSEWNNYANSETRAGVWERRTRRVCREVGVVKALLTKL